MRNEKKKGRTPNDGEPYYCKLCGNSYEHLAICLNRDCELESRETAKLRFKKGPPRITKLAKDLVAGDMVLMEDDTVRTVRDLSYGFATFIRGSSSVRGVLINWVEGDWSSVPRDFHCIVKTGDNV